MKNEKLDMENGPVISIIGPFFILGFCAKQKNPLPSEKRTYILYNS
ncbi:MAG: hypothetical protein RLZZ519_1595 [Bacteroidota bacterium]|jgi:hypothetical protein